MSVLEWQAPPDVSLQRLDGEAGGGERRQPGAIRSHSAITWVSLHAALIAVLAWWSWQKWPDPLIDFGRELYVPWQITQGKVLYRDIESLFGPLSPYLNALWFRLFGVSLLTLALANIAIFAATVAGIFRLLAVFADRSAAVAGTMIAIVGFGFLQVVSVGNYNFVTPYCHEVTHGLALSVFVLNAMQVALARRRRVFAAVAGLGFGGVFLTKPEVFLAVGTAMLAGFLGMSVLGTRERHSLRTMVPLFTMGAMVLPVVFFIHFQHHTDTGSALGAVVKAWSGLSTRGVVTNSFYVAGAGLDRPLANALRMVFAFVAFVVYVTAMVAISGGFRRIALSRRAAKIGRLVLAALAPTAVVIGLPRVFPLVVLGATVVAGIELLRNRHDRDAAMRPLVMLMWCAFSLVLLAKLGLHSRIHHYGFSLALPAATVVVILLFWYVPRIMEARKLHEPASRFRRFAVVVLIGAIAPYVGLSNRMYSEKSVPVASHGDQLLVSDREGYWPGVGLRDALDTLRRLQKPGDMLAVLPEGVMVNYLARMESPLRVITFAPPEAVTFGEGEILRALKAA